MNKYYTININPQASHEWDRCIIRNPMTGERPDLNKAIAETVKNQPGSYLIKVSIEVEILEQTTAPIPPAKIKPIPRTPERLLSITN